MTDDYENDGIPFIAYHRQVGIHDNQSPARIEIVKKAIDRVHGMTRPTSLYEYLADTKHPPEARLYAESKLNLMAREATADRRSLGVDMDMAAAHCAGLACQRWRSATHYGSTLSQPGLRPREQALDDK